MEENRNLENNLEQAVNAQPEQPTVEPVVEQSSQPSAPVNPYIVSSDYNANGQYQPVVTAPLLNQKNTTNHGMAITSLVLGIVATVLCCCCGMSVLVGIVGLVLGIIAKAKGNNEAYSLVGIILNAVGIFLSIALAVYYIVFVFSDPEFIREFEMMLEEYGYEINDYGTESSYNYYYNDYVTSLLGLFR